MTRKCVYFKLSAPDAHEVVLVGSFNGWEPRALGKQKQGVWQTFTALEPGTYEYRYIVDGVWRNDPEADTVPNLFATRNCPLELE